MPTQRITLPIYNLGCGGGGSLMIEGALSKTPGVTQAYVNPATEMAYVVYDPALANPQQVAAVIERIGYGPPPVVIHQAIDASQLDRASRGERRRDVRRTFMNDQHTSHGRGIGGFLRSPAGLVLIAFLAITTFYLVTEHTAHFFGLLPYGLLLLCPILHLLMHGGHGGHGGPDGQSEHQAHRTEGDQR